MRTLEYFSHPLVEVGEHLAEAPAGRPRAWRVGFLSGSSFSYRFTQMVGQGPRAYRQGTPELVLR